MRAQVTRRSAFVDRTEHGLDVDYGGAVDRLEVTYTNDAIGDGDDLDTVQADRVRTVRRPCREHALLRPVRIAPRANGQHVSHGAVEPREDQQLIAHPDAGETGDQLRLDDQFRLRGALVTLPRGVGEVDEW